MPNSNNKPSNLYELCDLVAEAIEIQPKNYFQDKWVFNAKLCNGDDACGTAFCRAGWITALMETEEHNTAWWLENRNDYIRTSAQSLLLTAGIPKEAINNLFYFAGIDSPYNDAFHNANGRLGCDSGTPEYAKAGADGMRLFMAQYEEKLKAAKL